MAFLVPGGVQARHERAKIDHVDTSDAPIIRIFVTFLKTNDFPVDPKNLEKVTVLIDGMEFDGEVQRTTFMDLGFGVDIVFVLSVHGMVGTNTAEAILEAAKTQISDQLKEGDRVGVVIDNGSALEIAPLGPPDGAGKAIGAVDPKARGSGAYTYDAITAGMGLFEDECPPQRKCVLIIVTDGKQTSFLTKELDADKEGLDEKDDKARKRAGVEAFLKRSVKESKAKRVTIFAVLYKPFDELEGKVIKLLTRKGGGTWRVARGHREVLEKVKYTFGEIYGQIVFTIDGELQEHTEYKFVVKMERKNAKGAITTLHFDQTVDEIKINWKLILIIAAIAVGSLILLVIIILVVKFIKKRRKKKKEEEEKLEEAKKEMGVDEEEEQLEGDEEEVEEPEVDNRPRCPNCKRVMLEHWEECLFCQRQLPKPGEVPKFDAAAAPIAAGVAGLSTAAFGADEEEEEVRECPDCGREMAPDWPECLFCAAGMGDDNDEQDAGAIQSRALAVDDEEEEEEEQDLTCPDCGREMKPHWPECLFCASSR